MTADIQARAACRECSETSYCGRHWTPQLEEAGWDEVANRMERWSQAGYAGDWRDPEYDELFDGEVAR